MKKFFPILAVTVALFSLAAAASARPVLRSLTPSIKVTATLNALDSTLVAIDQANPNADEGLRTAVAKQLESLKSRIADLNTALAETDWINLSEEDLAAIDTMLTNLESRLVRSNELLVSQNFGAFNFHKTTTSITVD